jgi:glutamyl-Q tRNA(Asp) synthetase
MQWGALSHAKLGLDGCAGRFKDSDMGFVTRFAPSPTGRLHLGHAFAALSVYDAARAAGGRFLLRIEDIDAARRRPEFEVGIFEDLAWLGLDWETPVRHQSEYMQAYGAALAKLQSFGLLYRCFRTRKSQMAEIASAPHARDDVITGAPLAPEIEAANLQAGAPYAWRLSLARSRDHLGGAVWDRMGFEADGAWTKAAPERLGDVILARKEFPASYHLACVHDDALQGITHVIRGEDLAEAAHIHVLLQNLLSLPTPIYRHHRLILGDDGKRLAKRDQAATLASLRAGGLTPAALRERLGLS